VEVVVQEAQVVVELEALVIRDKEQLEQLIQVVAVAVLDVKQETQVVQV
jgi:hypothetical protein